MNLLEKFILSKEAHIIEHYGGDGDLYVEFVQGDTVRRYKLHAIKEWLHIKCLEGDDCACQKLEELTQKEQEKSAQ